MASSDTLREQVVQAITSALLEADGTAREAQEGIADAAIGVVLAAVTEQIGAVARGNYPKMYRDDLAFISADDMVAVVARLGGIGDG